MLSQPTPSVVHESAPGVYSTPNLFIYRHSGEHLYAFATSLAIGRLIGLERERSASASAKAGLRTFALVALLGTICAMLSAHSGTAWPLAAGFLAVALRVS